MTTMMTAETIVSNSTSTPGASTPGASTASVSAVNQALQKFIQAPSVSNKVATMIALQAYFAEIEGRGFR